MALSTKKSSTVVLQICTLCVHVLLNLFFISTFDFKMILNDPKQILKLNTVTQIVALGLMSVGLLWSDKY